MSKPITVREAISQALMEEMERDATVFILGEEVGVWGGTYAVTRGFHDKYGDHRVKDTPISEAAIVGAAIGAALVGMRPVAELMTINFAFVAMDHIVNEAAKLRYMFGGQFMLPLVIRAVGGGGRQLGATHSQVPDAIFAHFPGLKVVAPGTPEDAKGLLKASIRSNDPIFFIENALLYQWRGEVPEGDFTVPIGQSMIRATSSSGSPSTSASSSGVLNSSGNRVSARSRSMCTEDRSVSCAGASWNIGASPSGTPLSETVHSRSRKR